VNYLKLLEILENDLNISNNEFETVKFFRKDITSVWVWFIVLKSFYKKTKVSPDLVLSTIPKEYASRVTIFKILDDTVKKKYFSKEIDINDKRKFIISPTNITIEEFEKWSLIFRGF